MLKTNLPKSRFSVIGNRSAVVAEEIRPSRARTKIWALACYAETRQHRDCT